MLGTIGWTIVILGSVGWVIWTLSGVVEGYFEVKNRPKETMFWCARHGMFRQKHALPIPGMTTVCPTCFKKSWDKAGK